MRVQAVSATQEGATGLQLLWMVAPTSQFIHETATARQVAATAVYESLVNLSTRSKNAYQAALKTGKAVLQAKRLPVPGGNGLANSWALEVQSVSTSGKSDELPDHLGRRRYKNHVGQCPERHLDESVGGSVGAF